MDNKTNPFDFMDFSLEEATKADDKLRTRPEKRDGRICLCGHPVGRHLVTAGVTLCKPTRMECPCKKVRPVIDSDDVRPFLRKTEGAGVEHALGRGMAAAMNKGIEFRWIVDMECDRCHRQAPLSPVPVSQAGYSSHSATGYDALLCGECRSEV